MSNSCLVSSCQSDNKDEQLKLRVCITSRNSKRDKKLCKPNSVHTWSGGDVNWRDCSSMKWFLSALVKKQSGYSEYGQLLITISTFVFMRINYNIFLQRGFLVLI